MRGKNDRHNLLHDSGQLLCDWLADWNALRLHPMPNLQGQSLTPRLTEVLKLMFQGKTIKETAALLRISTSAVRFHRSEIYKRLEVPRGGGFMALISKFGLESKFVHNLEDR